MSQASVLLIEPAEDHRPIYAAFLRANKFTVTPGRLPPIVPVSSNTCVLLSLGVGYIKGISQCPGSAPPAAPSVVLNWC